MFQRLSLKVKLLGGFLTLCLLMMGMSFFGWKNLREIKSDLHVIVNRDLPAVDNIGQMRHSLLDMYNTLLEVENNPTPANVSQAYSYFKNKESALKKLETEYEKIPSDDDDEVKIYNDSEKSTKALLTGLEEAFDDLKNGQRETPRFQQILQVELPRSFDTADAPLFKLAEAHVSRAYSAKDEALETAKVAEEELISLTLVGMILGFAIGIGLSISLTRSLIALCKTINDSATECSLGSEQLSAASQELSQGAAESAASLQETVASLEELNSMVKVNSDHVSEASQLSESSRQKAEQGEQEFQRLAAAMTEISEESKKIEDITTVIDDIAFQTNLLALNASVEAARAGEQGKGFSIVAEAVRGLAQRSASAAKDVAELIKTNSSKTATVANIANDSRTVLTDIVTDVKRIASINGEISQASKEQSQGLSQISNAMNMLDKASQENAAASEEVAASSEEMSGQAEILLDMVTKLEILIFGKGRREKVSPQKRASEEIKNINASPN